MFMVGPGPNAEDLAQAAMVEILRSLGNFRGEGSLESWADRIARRTILNLLKQRWRSKEVLTLDAAPEPTSGTETGGMGVLDEGASGFQEQAAERREVAQRLAVEVSFARKLVQRGDLPVVTLGRRCVRVRAEDVAEYVSQKRCRR